MNFEISKVDCICYCKNFENLVDSQENNNDTLVDYLSHTTHK